MFEGVLISSYLVLELYLFFVCVCVHRIFNDRFIVFPFTLNVDFDWAD